MVLRRTVSMGALALLLAAGAPAYGQTTTTTTPGTPNTGMGGEAAVNVLLLGSSALLAIAGAGYLMRRRSSLGR